MMELQFWGVEVKAGSPLKVTPKKGKIVHISQAALGERKNEKGSGFIPLYININDNKFVLGSLSVEKFPQITFDLNFEKEFELSHDWKNGSVYFCGYIGDNYVKGDEDDSDSEDDEEDLPFGIAENERVEPKAEEMKPATNKVKVVKPESSAKPKVTVVEPKKEESESDDDSDEDSEDDEGYVMVPQTDDTSGSEDEDDSDDEDESEDSDEETPKKPADKKRPNESASKTPLPAKKSKLGSAQKTDGKKGVHVDTPHPSKKAEKTPALNKQTAKSDAKISCSSCPKKFNSDSALQSHTKAKHTAK